MLPKVRPQWLLHDRLENDGPAAGFACGLQQLPARPRQQDRMEGSEMTLGGGVREAADTNTVRHAATMPRAQQMVSFRPSISWKRSIPRSTGDQSPSQDDRGETRLGGNCRASYSLLDIAVRRGIQRSGHRRSRAARCVRGSGARTLRRKRSSCAACWCERSPFQRNVTDCHRRRSASDWRWNGYSNGYSIECTRGRYCNRCSGPPNGTLA